MRVAIDKGSPVDLIIEVQDNMLVLREHKVVLRLGDTSAQWLIDSVKTAIETATMEEMKLEHLGKIVLTVVPDSKYLKIHAPKSRFGMLRNEQGPIFYHALQYVYKSMLKRRESVTPQGF